VLHAELEEAIKVLKGGGRFLLSSISQRAGAPVLRTSRAMVGISQKMLIQQLRDLEKHGVVARKVYPEVPPKVEYKLTKDGIALRAALKALSPGPRRGTLGYRQEGAVNQILLARIAEDAH